MPKKWQCLIGVAFCWLIGLQIARAEEHQRSFASAHDAASAFVAALREHNEADWHAILGPEADRIVDLKRMDADQRQIQDFLALYDEKHTIDQKGSGRAELDVGPDDWPLPILIVEKTQGRWAFDTSAGVQSIIDRRIGRNELTAIRTLLACVAAEHEYFERSEVTTGAGFYAASVVSTAGHQDGLYWPAAGDGTESPLGRLMNGAQERDFPGELDGDNAVQYEGYYFRVLKAQGPSADGGAKSYMESEHMTGGFALIAWPVEFASSGIMSFIVGADHVVYQRYLRPNTLAIAVATATFDPDLTWSRIDILHE